VFVSTEQIAQDLEAFAPWNVDVVTLSGSGEPTLALNLEEILVTIKTLTGRPSVVLTNSTLLRDAIVRKALGFADIVAAKLDAVSSEQLQRIDRPVEGLDLPDILAGLEQFRGEYSGHLAIQTMLLAPWSDDMQAEYIRLMQQLKPEEIQLNTPTRPRPLNRQLETRGARGRSRPYPTQMLKQVTHEVLQAFADQIQAATAIQVRCVPSSISERG
jgi:wyosine [tRNA(Phe)-imidazoG37] synthetase (radical SAM superfamily)